jgi:hypothetical protein
MAIFYQASTAEKTLPASFCSIQKLPQLFEETHAAIAGKTVVALTPKCKQRSCKSTHRNGQRTDGPLRHRKHRLAPLEFCSDRTAPLSLLLATEAICACRSNPARKARWTFFGEHPQTYVSPSSRTGTHVD